MVQRTACLETITIAACYRNLGKCLDSLIGYELVSMAHPKEKAGYLQLHTTGQRN